MTLYNHATLTRSPAPQVTVSTLAAAIGDRTVPAICRVMASGDSRNPDEGLALLDAYVAIDDVGVRQAVLDAVMAIAGTNPYRRERPADAATSADRKL